MPIDAVHLIPKKARSGDDRSSLFVSGMNITHAGDAGRFFIRRNGYHSPQG
jgi:hypothetical protein